MTDFTFACAKCNRRVPTNQVRLLPDGKHVCFECAGYKVDAPGGKALREGQKAAAPAVPKIRYHCQKCNYEFHLKEGHAKKCPYCNSERIEEKQGTAEKLLSMPGSYRDE